MPFYPCSIAHFANGERRLPAEIWRTDAGRLDLSFGPAQAPNALRTDDAKKWVLLVEDDEDLRGLLVGLLDEAGYHAKAVASGSAAMEILQTGRPYLIVADYLLDDMNGKELRRQIRESLGSAAPPFVLLTGFPQSSLKDISGVILQKPIDCERLLGVVAEHYSA
jgi:CheY-like chemotaxis protein